MEPHDVKRARLNAALTQQELAQQLGVSQALISHWESGRITPNSSHAAALEKLLGVSEGGESNAFGAWLQRERERADLSVADLAAMSGISVPAIYNIESGRTPNPRRATREVLQQALRADPPQEVTVEVAEAGTIQGLGELEAFDPYALADLPNRGGVYLLYDVSERPVYVGHSKTVRSRLSEHETKFWYKKPIVQTGEILWIEDAQLRKQIETLLIKFLKKNAVINQKEVDRE